MNKVTINVDAEHCTVEYDGQSYPLIGIDRWPMMTIALIALGGVYVLVHDEKLDVGLGTNQDTGVD